MVNIAENDKKEVLAVAKELKTVPDTKRDFIAGVLVGMERAEEIAKEAAKKTA